MTVSGCNRTAHCKKPYAKIRLTVTVVCATYYHRKIIMRSSIYNKQIFNILTITIKKTIIYF